MPTLQNYPRVFLKKAHLKGFKSINDLTIDFQENLTILIGKNGSGKSNFMEFLNQAMGIYRSGKIFFDYAKIDFLTNDNHSFVFELERNLRKSHVDKSDLNERVGVTEKFFIDDSLVLNSEEAESTRPRFTFKNKVHIYHYHKGLLFSRLGYSRFNHYYLRYNLPDNLDFISTPGEIIIDTESPFIDSINSFDFLESIIWGLEGLFPEKEEDEEYSESHILKDITTKKILSELKIQEDVLENIKKYSPIDDVRFGNNINRYVDGKNLIIENVRLEFKVNHNWMPWSQLSDGTRRLFYLIAEITYANGVILVEEPELGIHPHQFNLLMSFLKEQSERKQIIISTHSPKALDHLSFNELNSILIANYNLKKGTLIRHLTPKEITKAKKYMKEVGFFSDYWMLSDLE